MASLLPALATAAPVAIEVVKSLLPKNEKTESAKKKTKKVLKKAAKVLDIVKNSVNEYPVESDIRVDNSGSGSIVGHAAPFAQGTTTRSEFQMVDRKGGPFSKYFEDGCMIDCTEYLGEVSVVDWPTGVSVSKGSTIGQYFLHPRTIPSSRLDLMSRNYTHYFIEHLEVVYEPVVAATTNGGLAVGLVEDPKLEFVEGERGLRQLLETKDAVMFPVWQIQTLNHRMSNRTAPLVTRVGGSDMNLIFQGKLVVKAASDLLSSAGTYGNIVLKYRIHFYGSYLSEQATPIVDYDDVALLSAAATAPYYAAKDCIFYMANATPTYYNTKAYDRIVGIVPQVSFQCYLGADVTLYTIPAGRMLYALAPPSYAPGSVVGNLGPVYLSIQALTSSDATKRLTSTVAAGGTQVAAMPIQVWDIDYEYMSISQSALNVQKASLVQKVERKQISIPLEKASSEEYVSDLPPIKIQVPVYRGPGESQKFQTFYDHGLTNRDNQGQPQQQQNLTTVGRFN